ncbi:methylmalonyl-CoA mutase family protein [Chondromyces crocatus]|uniref:Methylmalonyl-CoA mutase n=1 Tax=Chondromyces crocatus TaxID=52 RepID=A0A0K1EK24_CHOCO|nr:methylmalonyl-CoA mutase family protein [Chondromyces crocatus]AKT41204.1 methylmalonyl-CoA mutase [Chondromyces crocatus]
MSFPQATIADWRAQVEKELAGAPFDKALVHTTAEGLSVQPLYTEPLQGDPGRAPLTTQPQGASFLICMRHPVGASQDALQGDLGQGTDGLWIPLDALPALGSVFSTLDPARTFFVFDAPPASAVAAIDTLAKHIPSKALRFALNLDPLGAIARGDSKSDPEKVAEALADLGRGARHLGEHFPHATAALVSTLAHHDAGADAADELAIALSTGVVYLRALLEAGLSVDEAARRVALQVTVGRDTFVELCKLRALRICWSKLLVASGVAGAPRPLVHAVCSSRTLTQRDPWVNMLRSTTQVFAAVLGGADVVTPTAFDQGIGASSALAHRVARNTGLVLREESHLGKVIDPAGGSYYLDTLTDGLAREAWTRFQAIERDGGLVDALVSGRVRARLAEAWQRRLERITRRKDPILGVSEFAFLDEERLHPPKGTETEAPAPAESAIPAHRDAEPFERLRARAEGRNAAPEVLLVTLGPFAESRARVGFATGFFAAGGLRTRESTANEPAPIACLCGSDERYKTEAADRARALKAAGCKQVLLAGRPGALEPSLREAGVDGFLFVGCDVVPMLSDLLDVIA